jgi:hypothetical protein
MRLQFFEPRWQSDGRLPRRRRIGFALTCPVEDLLKLRELLHAT